MPRCHTGSRRCAVNRYCFKKTTGKATAKRCKNGSRKCANKHCYRKTRKNAISRKKYARSKSA